MGTVVALSPEGFATLVLCQGEALGEQGTGHGSHREHI